MPRVKKQDEEQRAKRGRPYKARFGEESEDVEVAAASEFEEEVSEVVAEAVKDKPVSVSAPMTQDSNLIDIWERRMLNPDGVSSPPIHLKTPGMHLRWINTAISGRYQRAVYNQGWVPVTKDELADLRELQGTEISAEGYVTRGGRGAEILMKMPEAIFKRVQQRKAELRHQEYRKIRDRMAGAGSKHFEDKYGSGAGSEAGDIIAGFRGDIKFGSERVTYGGDE